MLTKKSKNFIKKILSNILNLGMDKNIGSVFLNDHKIDKLQRRFLFASSFVPCELIHHFWFCYDKTYDLDEDKIYQRFCEIVESKNINRLLFTIQLMNVSKMINIDILKDIVSLCKNIKSPVVRYWLTMDLTWITFSHQELMYDEYYNDRKALLEIIACESNICIPRKEISSQKRKLLILTFVLAPTTSNSAQRVAMMLANGFGKYFEDVLVLSLDSFASSHAERREGFSEYYRNYSSTYENDIKRLFGDNIQVKFADGKNYKERMQDSINKIYAYNPTVIFDMSDECSPMSYFYSKDFYTLYIPMRGVGSSSFYTNIEGRTWKFATGNEKYHSVDLDDVIDWSFPESVPSAVDSYTRKDLGLNENDFIVITIGSNEFDFEDEYIDYICEMITKNDRIVWLFVGGDAPRRIYAMYKHLVNNSRIISRGYENNLAGLCKICDIVLRGNVSGGSNGTAIAAMQGLPVVMMNRVCDPMRWLGRDFTDLETYSDVVKYIEELSHDVHKYEMAKIKTYEKIKKAVNQEEAWEDLYKTVEKKRMLKNYDGTV